MYLLAAQQMTYILKTKNMYIVFLVIKVKQNCQNSLRRRRVPSEKQKHAISQQLGMGGHLLPITHGYKQSTIPRPSHGGNLKSN